MYKTLHGLVLREVKYKESSKILTILTEEEGKITAEARGALRKGSKCSAASQVLTWSELTFFENRGRYTLTEGSVLEDFAALRADLGDYALGCYMAELLEAVSDEDSHSTALLHLGLNALFALSRQLYPAKHIKAVFELRAMCLSGYEPDLRGCAVCGAPEPDRFNISQGVLQCAACRAEGEDDIRLPMSAGTRAALRYLDSAPPSRVFSFRLAEPSLSELGQITESYLCTRLERGFSTLDFYKSLFL